MVKLSGNIGNQSVIKNLNINAIAQEENWEERYDALFPNDAKASTHPISKYTSTKYQIQKAAEFIKNNPDNACMAGLASVYQVYQEELTNKKSSIESSSEQQLENNKQRYEELLNDSEVKANFTQGKKNGEMWCSSFDTYEEWARSSSGLDNSLDDEIELRTNPILEQALSNINKISDLNNDGVIDSNDLALFKTNVDLDGDGTVSTQETSFLSQIKTKLTDSIYRKTLTKGINNTNTIDDVISYIDNYSQSTSDIYKNKGLEEAKYRYNQGLGGGYFEDENSTMPDRWVYHAIKKAGFNEADVCKMLNISTEELDLNTSYSKLQNYIEQMSVIGTPTNTYKIYIENADLSKEELEEILSKINNASASAQSQLAEVKSVVEEKLAAFSS